MSNPKIVESLGVMSRNRDKITSVTKEGNDFFSFKYLDKHVWAVAKPLEDEVWVRFYPGTDRFDGNSSEYVEYRKSECMSGDVYQRAEIAQSFEDLFAMVRDLYYHVDDVLDEIIRDDRPAT